MPSEYPQDKLRLARSALSDLYLDTDLAFGGTEFIARRLRESRIPFPELERIFKEEVAPVVYFNSVSVAGEWAGFNEDWLEKAHRGKQEMGTVGEKFGPLWHLYLYLITRIVERDWKTVKMMYADPSLKDIFRFAPGARTRPQIENLVDSLFPILHQTNSAAIIFPSSDDAAQVAERKTLHSGLGRLSHGETVVSLPNYRTLKGDAWELFKVGNPEYLFTYFGEFSSTLSELDGLFPIAEAESRRWEKAGLRADSVL